MKRKTICKNPTCPNPAAADSSYCLEHKAQAIASYEARQQRAEQNKRYNERRSEDDRYYRTKEWRELRAEKLKLHPNCQLRYEGCTIKGKIVHHRIKRKDGGSDTLENLQTTCQSCHNKTHSEPRKESKTQMENLLPEPPKKEKGKVDYRELGKLI